MEMKAEIRETLRERNRVIRQTGDRKSQEYDIEKAKLTEKSKLLKRVKTIGGKLVESISRRVSTSMPNGTNWEDVQNTTEAAKKRVVQQQQDHNAF